MDTFKKIYLIIIILTVLAFGVVALIATEKISIYGETGMTLYTLAIVLIPALMVLSRIGNIFGNRQNLFVGYFGAIVSFIFIILGILYVIIAKTNNPDLLKNLLKVLEFFSAAEALVMINVLVFEIPYVNDTHKKIQYVVAALLTLIFFIGVFTEKPITIQAEVSNSSVNISGDFSGKTSLYSYFGSVYDNNTNKTSEDLRNFLGYTCLALFFINPMLRVFWIDKDYYNARDVYEAENTPTQLTVNDMGKVHTNDSHLNQPQVDPNAAPTIPVNPNNNDQGVGVERANEPRKVVPHQTNDVIPEDEEFTEPVINKNFKPTDLSQVQIPSVDGENNNPQA